MPIDPTLRAHQEWLGYLQPVGLVVSPPALAAAQCVVNKQVVAEQQTLLDLVGESDPPAVPDLPALTRELLRWEASDLAGSPGGPELPRSLDVSLPEYGEVLSPTYAIPDPEAAGKWMALVLTVPAGIDLDAVEPGRQDDQHWHAGPQARLERLLRENAVAIGLLFNHTHLRLVHAPRGESSGHVTFPIAAMCEVPGRPILSALVMLLGQERMFALPTKQRLPAVLSESRRYQNLVSTKLAGQVLAALHELLRGFQAADEATQGALLREVLRQAPQDVYGGLLGTLMRLVFILYAEDRGLLPTGDPVYQQHYSLTALFERLRDDASRHPDTMEQRHGAWARLLTLFRLIHDGASHGGLRLPARHGRLFDPDTWDFLEGRPYGDILDRRQRLDPPRVSDGVVHRVLDNLLVLDGDRISYRALDVEQIGSVYEAMMGFELRVARGPSIALKPEDVVVDLAELLAAKPADRARKLADEAGCKLGSAALEALKSAKTPEDVVAALGKKVSTAATPRFVPAGAMTLQPSDERRRSGSHYTPRSLTEPIVRTTLKPQLARLGDKPRPEQILDLKVCDPAMGSGAFLVEACRMLGEALVKSWADHSCAPSLPPDEDPLIHAQRLVASRCLYGVDKNPFAVDLAKLSLWLATLARDHPFTFLDHALRHGDSLVGLMRDQIASFHWLPQAQRSFVADYLKGTLSLAIEKRAALHALGDEGDLGPKQSLFAETEKALRDIRLCADLVIAAYFGREKDKEREGLRLTYSDELMAVLEERIPANRLNEIVDSLRQAPRPVHPFHWGLEFAEVFARDNPGFDAFVGNPPFAGKNTLSASVRPGYPHWLQQTHAESHGNSDLVAHFFRRAFNLLRTGGTLGLIATNTIAQGDTRSTGLRWICKHGGTIYEARKRVKWPAPGAAVVVSVLHIARGTPPGPYRLDSREVPQITAFLFHDGGHDDPAGLPENAGKSFIGSYVLGMGFTFDDTNDEATPLAEMERLIAKDARNAERIFPYIGGEEVNDSPTHAHHRYVINFADMTEDAARRWPDLMAILEAKVRPERLKLGDNPDAKRRKRNWWQWGRYTPALFEAIRGLDRLLVCALTNSRYGFTFLPNGRVFDQTLVVFPCSTHAAFASLQSRCHEVWARFLGGTMKDDFRYNPSRASEPYPFPPDWATCSDLEAVGRCYFEFRANLMVRRNEGMTKTYGRFHDPDESDPDILRLRELHEAMDRTVLDAYGWTDLQPRCEFLLDYEDEEEDDSEPGGRARRKPWRCRWPDDIRDEVLARLLALNHERAAEEALAGTARQFPAGARSSRRTTGSVPGVRREGA